MSERRIIRNADTGEVVLARAKLAVSFWAHFKGLQLARRLADGDGILFVTPRAGRSHTAIHMFFVFFSIGVVWLDSGGIVVDTVLAKPWRPFYGPKAPAQYFIEANPDILSRARPGDRLRFDEAVP